MEAFAKNAFNVLNIFYNIIIKIIENLEILDLL